MSRRWFLSVLSLAIPVLIFLPPAEAHGIFRVDEAINLITKSGINQQLFTPRLREYFPETLVWQPELTTDKKGRAQIDFKLADNITTWKMSVIGSTEAGEIGMAETEIRAFQPFFAELDPPRVLTQYDRISPPVVLGNDLGRKQIVDMDLKPESWFNVLDVPAATDDK